MFMMYVAVLMILGWSGFMLFFPAVIVCLFRHRKTDSNYIMWIIFVSLFFGIYLTLTIDAWPCISYEFLKWKDHGFSIACFKEIVSDFS